MPPLQRVTSGLLSNSNAEHYQQQSQQLLAQAQHYVAQQQPTEALALVEQVLQIAPADTAALTLKGQLLGTIGRFPEALAVVEQLVQMDPNNALAWSMGAVLLTNMGQYQTALTAIEQALSLDPQNAETYGIKNSIMEQIAIAQSRNPSQKRGETSSQIQRGGPLSFLIGAVLQIIGLGVGVAGILLPVLQPQIPIQAAFALESGGLALLCVNAARGAFRHGFLRLLITLFLCIIPAAGIGIAYKFGYDRIILALRNHPNLIVPLFFLVVWLALAAILPLLLAIGGFIAGLILRVRRRKPS
jgi:tetratricopeptide (TPR) repeat protein